MWDWHEINSPEINPHIYEQLILTRVSRPFNSKEKSSINSAEPTKFPHVKEWNCTPSSQHVELKMDQWPKYKS